MLSKAGFDLWADDYDQSVGLSDEDGAYPFAGYRAVLGTIYDRVLSSGAKSVLDIGFGTGVLTAKLYAKGLDVYGQDFSEQMNRIAKQKMPDAHLVCADFSNGLADELTTRRYDAIVATYSLHHLTDEQKPAVIAGLQALLCPHGCLYIGDVAFASRNELEACKEACGEEWDDEEHYFVYDEIKKRFSEMTFEAMSHCAGLFCLKR